MCISASDNFNMFDSSSACITSLVVSFNVQQQGVPSNSRYPSSCKHFLGALNQNFLHSSVLIGSTIRLFMVCSSVLTSSQAAAALRRAHIAQSHGPDTRRRGTGIKRDNYVNSCSDLTQLLSLYSKKVGT